MKKLKKAMVVLLVVCIASALAGCKKEQGIDPEKYVSAYLNANLKGEVGELAEMSGEKKEDLEEDYEDMIEEVREGMQSAASMDIEDGSKISEVCKKFLASGKYEVTGSEKDEDDNYIVNVKAYPSDVMSVIFQKSFELGASGVDHLGEAMIETFDKAIDEQTYGEPEECQIRIIKDSKGLYSIEDDDIEKLMQILFIDENPTLKATGKVYDNPYYNWTGADWNAASEEEKDNCCLAIVQDIGQYTDEDMAMIDINDEEFQEGLQGIKDGIELSYSGGMEASVGDYIEMLKQSGALQ